MLTEVGIRQLFLLGNEMRHRYIEKEHLLPERNTNSVLENENLTPFASRL